MFSQKSLLLCAMSVLLFCSLTGIAQSMSISDQIDNSIMEGISSKYQLCQKVLGVNVCADVNVNNGVVNLKFTVAGVTIVNSNLTDLNNPEFCGTALGVKVCLRLNFNGDDLCMSVRASAPFLGSTSVNLGCVNVGSIVGK